MELEEIQLLLTDFNDLTDKVKKERGTTKNVDLYKKQYDPKSHDVADKTLRPDKVVEIDSVDAKGNVTPGSTTIESVARLPLAIQKKIVALAAAVLCYNPIKLDATPADELQKNILAVIQKTWEDNKLDYLSKQLAKLMMSETEVAEIWYVEPAEKEYWNGTPNEGSNTRLRVKVIANKFGDILYPIFNNAGDMVAFGRAFTLKVGDTNEDHFDFYLADKVLKGTKLAGTWDVKQEQNWFGKIPVIYYSQENPEWWDVQELIERLEASISNHGDTNDYNGSPIVKLKGKIKSFAAKGKQGKVIELEEGADADYMTWAQAPESIKLEQQNLRAWIFDLSDTPDITKDDTTQSGPQSGVALERRFLPAHLKAADKEETFGIGIQRRINLLKSSMGLVNTKLEPALIISIKPKFDYYTPKNTQAMVDLILSANMNKPILSQETSVAISPLTSNAEEELKKINNETNASLSANNMLNQ